MRKLCTSKVGLSRGRSDILKEGHAVVELSLQRHCVKTGAYELVKLTQSIARCITVRGGSLWVSE